MKDLGKLKLLAKAKEVKGKPSPFTEDPFFENLPRPLFANSDQNLQKILDPRLSLPELNHLYFSRGQSPLSNSTNLRKFLQVELEILTSIFVTLDRQLSVEEVLVQSTKGLPG
jgi:hypothetical protein